MFFYEVWSEPIDNNKFLIRYVTKTMKTMSFYEICTGNLENFIF